MTAKEAYNEALWGGLSHMVRNFIIDAVDNGKFQVNIEWGFLAI